MNLVLRQVSVSFAIKLKALTMIAVVLVDQPSQITVIIATANLHVQAFAAGMACNLMKPPNGRL
jgi:hypothetical protein